MNPQEQRIKATAVMFLTVALFLVRGAHAAPNAGGRTVVGTPRAGHLDGRLGADHAWKDRLDRLVGVGRTG